MKKEMLINVLQPEECRIAIVEDGQLEELYVERTSQESYVGNVYKGRIVNIEPSIQAAFVDFGIGRNGFLHVSDVDPAYYKHLMSRGHGGHASSPRHNEEFDEEPPRRQPRRDEESRGPRREEDSRGPRREEETRGPRRDEDPRPRRRQEPRDEPRRRHREPVEESRDRDFVALPPEPPEPSFHDNDDPYAALAGAFGSGIETEPPAKIVDDNQGGFNWDAHEEVEVTEKVVEEPRDDDRHRRPRESRHRGPVSHRHREEEPVVQLPPPLPKSPPKEESGFGSGIDIWGDDIPPPFMPSAERRTEDDEFDFNGESDSGASAGPAIRDREIGDGRPPRRGGFQQNRGRRGPARGRDGDGHQKPLIQHIFKRGQEVLVQVIKEGIGTKGPTLSTYISIAGRYLVLMPGLSRVGVSRKIEDQDQRHRLRDILTELKPPQGVGFIIRTAGVDRAKKELQNDLGYLLRIWQVIVKRIRSQKGPGVIYQETDMITRTIRDTFTNDIDAIVIDEPVAFQHAQEFLQTVMPKFASRLHLHDHIEPLFHRFGLDDEIAKINQKKLPLPGGGSIIIEQTEALVAIDVNSGSFRADNQNAEETAYQMNLNAAKEIARQLRLRDLGGVIVNDFIDMKDDKHRRMVEKAMRDAVKRDRARTKVLRISQFGIIEMTRQRIRPSLKRSVFQECPHCHGAGHVKTVESMSIECMRMIQLAACEEHIRRIEVRVHSSVADYLVNRRRREIAQLEDKGCMSVQVVSLRDVPPERIEFVCFDGNNTEVPLSPVAIQTRPPQEQRRGRR